MSTSLNILSLYISFRTSTNALLYSFGIKFHLSVCCLSDQTIFWFCDLKLFLSLSTSQCFFLPCLQTIMSLTFRCKRSLQKKQNWCKLNPVEAWPLTIMLCFSSWSQFWSQFNLLLGSCRFTSMKQKIYFPLIYLPLQFKNFF